MHIRSATIDDANAMSRVLVALVAANLRTTQSDPAFVKKHYIAHPDCIQCHVAEDADGTILGFQSLRIATAENIYGVAEGWGIIGTHIDPAAARRGIGRALFAATSTVARDANLHDIDATIGATNIGGLAYYENMGFRTYRRIEGRICKRHQLEPPR